MNATTLALNEQIVPLVGCGPVGFGMWAVRCGLVGRKLAVGSPLSGVGVVGIYGGLLQPVQRLHELKN